jgi:proline iminopeptidase
MHSIVRTISLPQLSPALLLLSLIASFVTSGCADATPPPAEPQVADSGSIQSGDFNLDYRIEGTGAPAIVIGFPGYYSRIFSDNLRSHLRMVFVDHRGSAASPGSVDRTEFDLEALVDDVELVREILDLGRVIVIGHSGHSYMALEYAKKYPTNVSHVVMIGIAPDMSASSDEATAQNWEKLASAERKSALEENRLEMSDERLSQLPPGEAWIKTYVRKGPRAWYDPHFDSSPLWDGVDVNMDMFNYVWGEIFRDIDVTQGLENFDRPVFLALGRYDFLVAPPSSWEPIKDRFHDVTVRVFENSGHTPQYEESILFDRELLGWIDAHVQEP